MHAERSHKEDALHLEDSKSDRAGSVKEQDVHSVCIGWSEDRMHTNNLLLKLWPM